MIFFYMRHQLKLLNVREYFFSLVYFYLLLLTFSRYQANYLRARRCALTLAARARKRKLTFHADYRKGSSIPSDEHVV